ncbi:MAG: putative kinesin family protein [Benniella sp.]|nr:MAG: putative kinesin family protein [Benniella sp.]
MEQLNRSISKLKPPTKITPSSSSSSAIATALAVAAALSDTENIHVNKPGSSTTPGAGLKRKAEEHPFQRNAKHVSTGTTRIAVAAARQPTSTTHLSGTVNGSKPANPTKAGTTVRAPLSRVTAAPATAASRRPPPATPKPTVTPNVRPKTVATAATTRPLAKTRHQQQPSPAPSVSESSAKAGAGTGSRESSVLNGTNGVNPTDMMSMLAISKKKKRPAWDTKGRLEDMEEVIGTLCQELVHSTTNMKDLTSKLESSQNKIAELETFRQGLASEVAVKENENKDILQKMKHVEQDLQMTAKQCEDQIQSLKTQHSLELEQLRMTQSRLKQETEMLESRLRATNSQLEQQMQENTSLRSTISTQSSNCLALESDNRALKMKIERTEDTLAQRELTIESLKQQLSESQMACHELEKRIRNEETIRRRLHNTIQELKGNIRVFCRVRPVTTAENASKAETNSALIKYPDQEGREIEFAHAKESATGSQIEKTYPFTFDKVFQPTSTQDDVFEEISQLVQSALDGYHVCIFAYGQTGSGKTFTMEGPLNATLESKGMIPRSVFQIYENAKALESKGWTYTMEGQYVEIYNETINDLLGNDGLDSNKKHEIRHGPNGKTTITDITTVVLTSPEKVAAILKKAAHARSVGATQMNERSSRSHCVFTLRLSGKNSITEEASEGVLNLIDLAGSERLSQSGATGDRLKETQAINKSLSCLGDVIYAISNKDPHIPYRNSKLTYLLQNSLGGNSKTLMFVNISPLMTNLNETLCSLRFATKVNSCTIGTATKRAVKS